MKKYIKPTTEVILVKMQQMIAASPMGKSETPITDPSEILSRESEDDWDIDY